MKGTLRALVSCAVVAALLLPCGVSARQAKKFELTVDSIMRGPDLVGYPPTSVVWSQDGGRVYFRWKRAGEPRLKEQDTYVVGADGTGLRKLSEDEARRTAPPLAGELSKDRRLTVFTDEGDVFLYDHEKAERRQLTRTVEAESNARFTRDQRRVYFTRQNNLYVLSLDGGSLEQLTDIRTADAPPRALAGAQTTPTPPRVAGAGENQEFLRREERKLIEAVREQAEQREEQERRRRARATRRPLSLPAGQTVSNLLLSPDGTYVVATTAEQATGSKSTIVPNFVTESAYTEDIPARTKVGDAQSRSRMAVLSVETGEVKWVEHGQRVEVAARVQTRTEQNATAEAQRERGAATAEQQSSQTQQSGQQSSQQS
ncbi:MAG TPA: DPP IV N-terminal domain-containing protein, partial [Pyrinomonadaceae bacterium]|nr:DPP IV N-terminal domain-containing protein [Pyrinomonadaceae bacterium]